MSLTSYQLEFFARIHQDPQLLSGYNYLSDVLFFVKDLDSRLVFANDAVLHRLGLDSVDQISGKSDLDFFPESLAACFRRDDLRVFASGQPLIHRLEAWYDELHELKWFLTTKIPLCGPEGEVVGLMVVMRRDAKSDGTTIRGVAQIVEYVREHATDQLCNSAIAKEFSLSERTLHRKLQESLGVTPHELVIRTRLQKAAEDLIHTDRQISQIAADLHFCDQSAFTQTFKKRIGMTPMQFRLHHKSSCSG